MKKYLKQSTAFLLAVIMALGLLPALALAANNEDVLTSIDHPAALSVDFSKSNKTALITIPFGDKKPLELSPGLTLDFSDTLYSSATATFPGGSVAEVGGGPVSMLVTYFKVNDETAYTSTYEIRVKEKEKVEPQFSGVISKSVVAPADAAFMTSEFTNLYEKNDGEDISHVSIDGTNPGFGSLKLNGSDYVMQSRIAKDNLSKLVFDSTETTDGGSVTYLVTAYTADDDAAKVSGIVRLTVQVGVVSVPTITKAVTKSVNSGSTVTFSLSDFSSCYNLNNGTLKNIIVTPVGSVGTWYNGSSIITSATSFTSATIGNLKYKGSVSGNGSFKWTVSNETGASAEGSGTVTVSTSVADVVYAGAKGNTIVFDDSDFSTVAKNAGFGTLDYIEFTDISKIPKSCVLNYNYVSSTSKGSSLTATNIKSFKFTRSNTVETKYYLDRVAFLPTASYDGSFTLSYKGYDTAGNSYTGQIKITMRSLTADTIEYETLENETVTFRGIDFNNVCKDLGLKNLDYIQFSAPASSKGTIYYNYASESSLGTKIGTSTKLYYRSNDTVDLNKVAFKPYKNYYGTVNVSYMGYDLDGVQFSGTVSVVIGEDHSDVDPVIYSTSVNKTLKLDGDDFNDVCEDEGYEELNYLTLNALPNSDKGVFYYNYASASSPGTKPSTSTRLYYDSNDKYDLDKVAFIPAKNYEGSFIVAYNGVDIDGDRFVGQIKITVSEGEATLKDVTYVTVSNTPLTLVTDDFNKVCKNETGYNLSYIQFTLPGSSYGKLYTAYNTGTGKGTAVTASTKYYRSSTPRIDTVTFVPATAYTGVVTVNYTGEDTDGTLVSGKLLITVLKDNGASSRYFDDVGTGHVWAGKQIDYLYEEGIVKGTGGKSFSPGANIIRGDFVLMLHRSVKFSSTSNSNFSDVPKSSYYYDAIAAARASGIAEGDNGNFYPTRTLTRQDAMVLVYRAVEDAGYGLSKGTSSNLTSFSDRGSISSYATTAVATLVKAGVIEGNAGKINPLGNITRAEMSVILYRVLNLD